MKYLLVLALFAPLVLCRVVNDFNSGLTADQIEKLEELKFQVKQLSKYGDSYMPISDTPLREPTEDDISVFVCNKADTEGTQISVSDAAQIASKSKFNVKLDTVFTIHGWHSTYASRVNILIKEALLQIKDVNVIAVYWDGLASGLYLQAKGYVPFVGFTLGNIIKNISASYNYPLSKITLMGHSLGAHVAGFAGEQTNGQLATIVGMDPAGPFYFKDAKDGRLSDDDAKYVQVVHTNAQFLGIGFDIGHADFWPNGGWSQPGCGLDPLYVCSHGRSYEIIAESITNNQFYARECDSYDNFEGALCKANQKKRLAGPVIDTTITGEFYLDTDDSSPYALGDFNDK